MTAQEALQALLPDGPAVPDTGRWRQIAEALEGTANLHRVVYTWRDGVVSTEPVFGTGDRRRAKAPGTIAFQKDAQTGYSYLRYLPPDFDGKKTWPLVLFFHGIGERGEDPSLLLRHGLPRYLLGGGRLDAVVVAPQCPADSHWADGEGELERLKRFLPRILEEPFVDRNRVYVTGLSMGGRCAWKLALAMPNTFAAMAVICGRTEQADLSSLRDLPIWMFHGVEDRTTPFHNIDRILARLDSQGHRYRKLTVYPTGGHDVWTDTYAHMELYDWLLSQSRSDPGASSLLP